MSWVALDDVLGAVHHALLTDDLEGPFNLVSPEPVTNRAFTETLGRVLGRPTLVPVPAFALRLALGEEMANSTLLASQRAKPENLEATGYAFRFPTLEGALRHVLGRAEG
jgi:NAD dependent epimerase/dehydratase family enzyme